MGSWQQIRTAYPEQWVLVEAMDAYTENDRRVINHLELIAEHGDNWLSAWQQYERLHQSNPYREYYVLHTSNEALDIRVIQRIH